MYINTHDGDRAWVTLLQEKAVIKLRISDNGTAELSSLTAVDPQKHKGIVWVPPSGHKNIGQANRACPIIGFGRAGAFSAMRPVT